MKKLLSVLVAVVGMLFAFGTTCYACDDPEAVQLYKGYVYALDGEEGNLVKTSQTNVDYYKVVATEVNDFVVAGNRIYLVKGDSLYQVNLNGKSAKMLVKADAVVAYKSNYVYYQYGESIMRVNVKTKKSATLGKSEFADWELKGNYVFFKNASKNNQLYRMKLTGKSKKRLTKERVNSFTISGNNLYLYSQEWGYAECNVLTIKRINLKTCKSYKLAEFENVDSIQMVGTVITFCSNDGCTNYWYNMKIKKLHTEEIPMD